MIIHGATTNVLVLVNGIMMACGAGVLHDVHDAFLTFIPGRID
jgi:hypothetical protein